MAAVRVRQKAISKRSTQFGDAFHEGDVAAMHQRLGNAWWAWTLWVMVLEQCADFIWERSAYSKGRDGHIKMPLAMCVQAMLLGYATECVLKGLWVKNGNRLIDGGKYLRVRGARDHDLVQLAAAVGFTTTARETDTLRRLSKFSSFAGRYPVSKKADDMVPHLHDTLGKVDVGYFSPQDFKVSTSVINKIVRKISGKKRSTFPRRRLPARFLSDQR